MKTIKQKDWAGYNPLEVDAVRRWAYDRPGNDYEDDAAKTARTWLATYEELEGVRDALLDVAWRVAEHFADTDAPLGAAARAAIAKAEGRD